MTSILNHIADFVQSDMESVCTAHDFAHIQRVVRNAERISAEESEDTSVNMFIALAAAYLYEYFDEKFRDATQTETRTLTLMKFLHDHRISEENQQHIIYIIKNVGYGKSLTRGDNFPMSPEFMIVEDADRLDAIGAIAIGRTFAYGGKKGRPLYDPTIAVRNLENDEQYRDGKNTSINHFYEKLLLLKDLMHTPTGRILAQPRHEYMEQFVKQFLAEWNE